MMSYRTLMLAGAACLLAACQSTLPASPDVLTDPEMAALHDRTLLQSLESLPDRNSLHWSDEARRAEGFAVPLGTTRLADGTFCRDYYTKAIVDGVAQLSSGRACRLADGRWVVDRTL